MENAEIFYYFLYFLLNFVLFILVIFSQKYSIIKLSLLFHINQICSSSLSILFLSLTRNKPGYIEKDTFIEKENKNESKIEINSNIESSPIVNLNIIQDNGCQICQISNLPLRSLHCNKCNKCVRGFDHHCWILAGCIGENNRFSFILFLFFQNNSNINGAYVILKILNNIKSERLSYIITLLFSIMCLLEIIFFWIFIYHLYLLITNQSTYEIFNEEKCPYLLKFIEERQKILAQRGISIINNSRVRPFDMGIRQNIFIYFMKMFRSEKTIDWELIYYENLKTKKLRLHLGDRKIHV